MLGGTEMHRKTSAGARCCWTHVVALFMSNFLGESALYGPTIAASIPQVLNSFWRHSFKA
jgi:hypothetical protein